MLNFQKTESRLGVMTVITPKAATRHTDKQIKTHAQRTLKRQIASTCGPVEHVRVELI